jgi:hypothetical protein
VTAAFPADRCNERSATCAPVREGPAVGFSPAGPERCPLRSGPTVRIR